MTVSHEQTRLIFDSEEIISRLVQFHSDGDKIIGRNHDPIAFPASTWSAIESWISTIESFLRTLPKSSQLLDVFQDCPERKEMHDFYEAVADRQARLKNIRNIIDDEHQGQE